MKTIGIKLADGTFYPVLQEDQPGEKLLELTTAHNDQTRVMVDLYRTKTGTMEEAEYVDTLQINHLNKHPSGEATISFVISIDENNELSARIVDSETGAESETTIELINRTLEERLGADPTESDYNINDTISEEPISEEQIADDTIITEEPIVTEEQTEMPDLDLPDFGDVPSSEETFTETTSTDDDFSFDMPDDTASTSEDNFSSADLDLPDFGSETISETTSTEDNFNSADLDLPDFGDDSFASTTSTSDDPFASSSDDDIFGDTSPSDDIFGGSSNDDDIFGESSSTPAAAPMNGGMFDGLYDTGDFDKQEEETKKTKAPVIICIICAIICIAAVILIFFVIPSKINLLGKTGNTEIAQIEKIETPPVATKVAEPEPEPEPVVPSAKEDEIVVIEKAEEVKPEPPAPPAPEPKPDIIYKVKWGDTLWDIADTYYKNPWRYIKIANYNGIKNPDYIISGTTILIPQE